MARELKVGTAPTARPNVQFSPGGAERVNRVDGVPGGVEEALDDLAHHGADAAGIGEEDASE